MGLSGVRRRLCKKRAPFGISASVRLDPGMSTSPGKRHVTFKGTVQILPVVLDRVWIVSKPQIPNYNVTAVSLENQLPDRGSRGGLVQP